MEQILVQLQYWGTPSLDMFQNCMPWDRFWDVSKTSIESPLQVFNNLGNAVSFVLGPYLVPYKEPNTTTATNFFLEAEGGIATTWSREDIRERIQWYMIGQAAFSCALLLLILAYFPAKPLTPPSPSGFVQRTDYLPGIKALATNRYVLLSFVQAIMITPIIASVWMHQ